MNKEIDQILSFLIPLSSEFCAPPLSRSMIEDYEESFGKIENLESLFVEIIMRSEKFYTKGINQINQEEFQEIIDSIWRDQLETFSLIGVKLLEAYYRDGKVMESLGFKSGPMSQGRFMKQSPNLVDLLAQVIEKGSIYRTI